MTSDITIIYEWSQDGWWVAEIAEVPGAALREKPNLKPKQMF